MTWVQLLIFYSGAQGEYGATWDFDKFWLYQNYARLLKTQTIHGVANTELCQKICIASSTLCEAWTFNFQTYQCILYDCYGYGGALPTKASFIEHKGSINPERSLEATPWVSGPRNIY